MDNTLTTASPSGTPPRTAAVIDIGTSSVRMAIGEIREDGSIRTLETLTQSVGLGKDTFTQGTIARSTIEDCVRVLTSYREVLTSYGITGSDLLRCVATSAVREAENRLAFIDRVYIATGIQVEPLDEAEVSRVTFLSVEPTLKLDPVLSNARSVVVEVGGGSTELLVVEQAQVIFSHSYNLGSLRLRQTLDTLNAPIAKRRQIMESHIQRFVSQAGRQIRQGNGAPTEVIALGGDFRFAVSQLLPERVEDVLATISTAMLSQFVERMFPLSVDELVHDFHLTYPDAETLGPSLLSMLLFLQELQVDHVRVSDVNLRDGLLHEIANQGVWSEDFQNQVINSTIDLGRKYAFDESHARHVAELSGMLFDALQSQHRLGGRYRVILHVASLLHEIGLFVGITSYHKHTMYLIQNSELFGLSRRDLQLVALVARYHRRASPKPTHNYFSNLDREERVIVAKLASILRVADALDRSYSQRIREIDCSIKKHRLSISIPGLDDVSLEQITLKQTVQLFEETYGLSVLLRRSVT
jgi:exopolyphosphatase/guanosine-5'-triphosphate,3'-diphosphate pyrophosphatase